MLNKEEKLKALLLDNRFVDWINNPESPYSGYWLQWVGESSDNAELADEARQFLLELHAAEVIEEKVTEEKEVDRMWGNIEQSIGERSASEGRIRRTPQRGYWMAAAAIAGVLLLAGVLFFRESDRPLASFKKKERAITIKRQRLT